jgi:hypothetical protein
MEAMGSRELMLIIQKHMSWTARSVGDGEKMAIRSKESDVMRLSRL